jgi:hypothetical protein
MCHCRSWILSEIEVLKTRSVIVGYVEQNLGYGRQDEAMLPSWHIQDGVGSRQAAVVFTEVSEKAVIRWAEDDRKPEASRYS